MNASERYLFHAAITDLMRITERIQVELLGVRKRLCALREEVESKRKK